MSNLNNKIMEKKFYRLSERDIEVAKLYAIGSISWEDVKYLLGYMVAQREQDIKNFAAEYAVQFDLYVFNCKMKTPTGFQMLREHAALIAEEYDLAIEDLSVVEVINSLVIKISIGLIVY